MKEGGGYVGTLCRRRGSYLPRGSPQGTKKRRIHGGGERGVCLEILVAMRGCRGRSADHVVGGNFGRPTAVRGEVVLHSRV